jgi:hypothetical protein
MKKTLFLFLFLPAFVFGTETNDFKFYKEFSVTKTGIYNFEIDNDIESKSEKFLADIRIFDNNDKEIKYKIIKEKDEYKGEDRVVDLDFKKIKQNTFLIDLKNDKKDEYLNHIILINQTKNFRRLVDV